MTDGDRPEPPEGRPARRDRRTGRAGSHRHRPVAGGAPEFQPFLGALLDRLPLATLLLDGTRVIHANPAAAFLLGRESADLVGRTPEDLSGAAAEFCARIDSARRHVESRGFSWNCRRPDGSQVDCEVQVSVVDAGPAGYAMAVLRDLSSARVPEAELRQAQKMELMGQLAGGIAHDFNNLLTALEGHLDLVSGGAHEAARADALRNARRCAARAAGLSRRLMDFSRHDRFEPEVVAADELIGRMQPLLRSLLRPEVRFETRIDPGARPVLVDCGQMEQALMNLALNAQDAMPQGGDLTLQVTFQDLDDAAAAVQPWTRQGRYTRIDVRDTGTGIPYAEQPRIFEPFFTSKPKRQGTGLGLSVVYGIVKQHRGFIHVDSGPGRGTTFSILLPAADLPLQKPRATATGAQPTAAAEPRAAADAVDPGRGKDARTVLLVEDDDMIRDLARTTLSQAGYRVLAAASATAAQELFAAEDGRVDLLVTDLVLPGKSGRELARDLLGHRADLAVIYTSGYDTAGLPRNLAPDPGSPLLEKPYTLRELAARVRQVLQGG